MSNDLNDAKPTEDTVACIALSKNDSYVMSASGGKVSLFNMMTFKVQCRRYLMFPFLFIFFTLFDGCAAICIRFMKNCGLY